MIINVIAEGGHSQRIDAQIFNWADEEFLTLSDV